MWLSQVDLTQDQPNDTLGSQFQNLVVVTNSHPWHPKCFNPSLHTIYAEQLANRTRDDLVHNPLKIQLLVYRKITRCTSKDIKIDQIETTRSSYMTSSPRKQSQTTQIQIHTQTRTWSHHSNFPNIKQIRATPKSSMQRSDLYLKSSEKQQQSILWTISSTSNKLGLHPTLTYA